MHMDNQKSDNEAIGNEEASEERIVGLRPLAPVLLSKEDMAAYEDEFDFAFKEDRIRNIALSGPYGAGKNTVMESWESLHPELSFIHVELAHFEEPDGNDLGDGKSKRNLEAEILNQLIHKIDAAKTPKSRFKRTADRDGKADWKAAVAIVAFVVISAVLAWVLNAYTFVEFLALPIPALVLYAVMGAAWLALAVYGVKHLMKTSFLSKTMKKLKFVNAEVEVADRGDDSAFNRLMDDLLYLLNGSECSAIVFEDLDRFKNIGIFEKLRTINSLANQSRPAGSRLKFVYLVHDGLFSDSHDRTKFFDYIIPVIPYVDTSNSFDILGSGLQGIGVSVDDRFMRGLSVFIDDPRILNAIVDEAFHYSRALGGGLRPGNAEDAKRLVGAIAYKETFPRDYESLQVGRGYLHALLNSRTRLLKKSMGRIDAETDALRAQAEEIQRKDQYDEEELALLYLSGRLVELRAGYGYNADFSSCKSPQEILARIHSNSNLEKNYNNLKATLDGNAEYQSRLASSNQRREEEIGRLQASIDELEAERAELDRKPLGELFCREEDFDLSPSDLKRPKDYEDLHFEQVKDSPYFGLIPYLIRSGAIDESYQRYTSNFYPYSLTAKDRDFVTMALQGISEADPAREIDSPGTVLEHLDESSLGRRQARNYALLERLLEENRRNELDALFRGVEADMGPRIPRRVLCIQPLHGAPVPVSERRGIALGGRSASRIRSRRQQSHARVLPQDRLRRRIVPRGSPDRRHPQRKIVCRPRLLDARPRRSGSGREGARIHRVPPEANQLRRHRRLLSRRGVQEKAFRAQHRKRCRVPAALRGFPRISQSQYASEHCLPSRSVAPSRSAQALRRGKPLDVHRLPHGKRHRTYTGRREHGSLAFERRADRRKVREILRQRT